MEYVELDPILKELDDLFCSRFEPDYQHNVARYVIRIGRELAVTSLSALNIAGTDRYTVKFFYYLGLQFRTEFEREELYRQVKELIDRNELELLHSYLKDMYEYVKDRLGDNTQIDRPHITTATLAGTSAPTIAYDVLTGILGDTIRVSPIQGYTMHHADVDLTTQEEAPQEAPDEVQEEEIQTGNIVIPENFKNAMKRRFEQTIRNEESNQRNNQISADDYKRRYLDYLNRIFVSRCTIEGLKNKINEIEAKIMEELNTVTDISHITGIRFEDDKIVAHTDTIYVVTRLRGETEDTKFLIGDFDIKIDLVNNEVRMINTTNKRKSYWSGQDNAPHVRNSGQACWGNVDATVAQLLSSAEVKALLSVVVNYLESVNLDDPAGKCIVNWDRVDKDGNIIPKMKKCPHCNKMHPERDFKLCSRCNTMVCTNCIREDDICKNCFGMYQITCEYCGCETSRDNAFTVNGRVVCKEHRNCQFPEYVNPEGLDEIEEETVECTYCHNEVPIGEEHNVGNETLCENCFDNHFGTCEDCGCIINRDDDGYHVAISDNLVCDECYDRHYFTCEDCGDVMHCDLMDDRYEDYCYCHGCADARQIEEEE